MFSLNSDQMVIFLRYKKEFFLVIISYYFLIKIYLSVINNMQDLVYLFALPPMNF